jgi:hypothetical protein
MPVMGGVASLMHASLTTPRFPSMEVASIIVRAEEVAARATTDVAELARDTFARNLS